MHHYKDLDEEIDENLEEQIKFYASKLAAEDSLYEFCKQAWPTIEGGTKFIGGMHIQAVCEHLEAATRGDIKRLLISVPPRMSKTTAVSIMWPAWTWTRQPHIKFLFSSYSQKISWEHSRICKMLIESYFYKSRWGKVFELTRDQATKGHFVNNKQGARVATSVGAGTTALGGDVLVCLPYNACIYTCDGEMRIGDLVEGKMQTKVLSYNHATKTAEYKEIEAYEHSGTDELYVLDFGGIKLECTHNHPIFDVTANEYVYAKDLSNNATALIKDDFSLTTKKLVSMSTLRTRQKVYNLRIKDNHNYFANNVLVHNCDDPNEAGESQVARDSTNDWVSRVWPSRLNPGGLGINVLVQQRTHNNDVSGVWLEKYDDSELVKLVLPMEYDPARKARTIVLPSTNGKVWEDPRTIEGELLCPQYLNAEDIARKKIELGSYNYAGQYQQLPAPAEGGIFKKTWFQIYKEAKPPFMDFVVQSWDTAFTVNEDSSYSACTTWGVFKLNGIPQIMLLSAYKGKLQFHELLKRAKRLYNNWTDIGEDVKPASKNTIPDILLIESKASGNSLADDFISKGIPARRFNPDKYGDKEQRAHKISPYIEAGLVWIAAKPPNFTVLRNDHEMLIDQAALFPKGESKDIVDSMTQAMLYLTKEKSLIRHTMDFNYVTETIPAEYQPGFKQAPIQHNNNFFSERNNESN